MPAILDAIGIFAYLAFVAIVAAPANTGACFFALCGEKFSRAAVAFYLALLSTLFIPWTGVHVFPFAPSWLFFPLFACALLIAVDDKGASLAFIFCLASAFAALNIFSLNRGVPGDLYGLDLFSAAAVLSGYFDIAVRLGLLAILAGCIWAFASIGGAACHSMLCFSFAGGVVSSTALFRLQPFFQNQPHARAIADFVFALALSIALQRVLLCVVAHTMRKAKRIALPALMVVAGCALLIASL